MVRLRSFASNSTEWHKIIFFATFVYNNSIHASTGYTPHELAHGHKIQIPTNVLKRNTIYNYDNLANEIKTNIQYALEEAKKHLLTKKLKNKMIYDQNMNDKEITPNDLVLIKSQAKSSKFETAYHGPYRVISVTNPYLTIIKKGKTAKIHKNLVKKSVADHTTEPPYNFPIINLENDEQLYHFITQYIKKISTNRFVFNNLDRFNNPTRTKLKPK